MNSTLLGASQSTDPKPRRKTDEPTQPNRAAQLIRWHNEENDKRKKEELMMWDFEGMV